MDEEYTQDMMYLSVHDEDNSPGKYIPYFTPCRQRMSVPEEMAVWEQEKRRAAREIDNEEDSEPKPLPPIPRHCPRRAARRMAHQPAPGWRRGHLPGLPRPSIYYPCWGVGKEETSPCFLAGEEWNSLAFPGPHPITGVVGRESGGNKRDEKPRKRSERINVGDEEAKRDRLEHRSLAPARWPDP